jgi:PAS domain S-box-containing protein
VLRKIIAGFARLATPTHPEDSDPHSLRSAPAGTLLASAVRLAGLGCWTWKPATGRLTLSPEAQRIFGYDEHGFDGTLASWLRSVDALDARVLQSIEDQVRGGQRTFSFEYRFTTPQGRVKRLKSDGQVVALDEQRRPLELAGTVMELGDLRSMQDTRASGQRMLLPGGVYEWQWEQDAEHRFTDAQGSSHMPLPAVLEVVGHRRWELPHAVPLHSSWHEHVSALEQRQPFREFEYRVGQGPEAVYIASSGDPVFDASGVFRGYTGTALDITRRVKAEQDATQTRILLEQASRLGQLGAWALRLPAMEVEWSRESRSILGYPKDAPLSWPQALAQIEEPYRTQLQAAVAECVAHEQPFSLEVRAANTVGRPIWLRIVAEPEPAITGPARRVIGALQDISARKQDARRLQELTERLVNTLESITEAFYTVDRQWRFTYVNHQAERVARRSRAEMLGRTVTEVFPSFAGGRFEREFKRALADGRSVHFEEFSQAAGVWMDVYAYPSPQGLAVYFQDITEARQAREALQGSEERHRLLFEASMDAIFSTDWSGNILAANAAACQMFGMTQEQLRAQRAYGLVAPHEARLQGMLEVLEQTGRSRGQLTMVRADGTRFEAEISAAHFEGSDGHQYGKVLVRDITQLLAYQAEILALNDSLARRVRERTAELETANEDLGAANAELEAANADLRAFAHSLAHDLRTPIAAIDAFGAALQQRLEDAGERERGYVERIRLAAQQLDQYVEALLSQARIANAQMQATRIDLSAMAESVLADLRLQAPARAVVTNVQPNLGATGDPTLLRMALENLLCNAWKFTSGRELAQIGFSAAEEEEGFTTFCVTDNGAGFAPEYAHKLFGAFQRLHTQAEFPGTGIGLANVHRIIARHGGRIWAVAAEDAGASFYFTLPHGPG